MTDWLRILNDAGKPVIGSDLVKGANVPPLQYNDSVAELHALAKAGAIYRWRDDSNNWIFSASPEVERFEAPPVPRDESLLPSWALPPVWDETKGPANGVFANKKPGETCLWSCWWSGTSGPCIVPSVGVWSLDSMGDGELLAELRDVAMRPGQFMQVEAAQIALSLTDAPWTERLREGVQTLLGHARQSYKEYTAPWGMPAGAIAPKWRPSWGIVLPPDESLGRLRGSGGWAWFSLEYPRGLPISGPKLHAPPLSTTAKKLAAGYPVVTSEGISR